MTTPSQPESNPLHSYIVFSRNGGQISVRAASADLAIEERRQSLLNAVNRRGISRRDERLNWPITVRHDPRCRTCAPPPMPSALDSLYPPDARGLTLGQMARDKGLI